MAEKTALVLHIHLLSLQTEKRDFTHTRGELETAGPPHLYGSSPGSWPEVGGTIDSVSTNGRMGARMPARMPGPGAWMPGPGARMPTLERSALTLTKSPFEGFLLWPSEGGTQLSGCCQRGDGTSRLPQL